MKNLLELLQRCKEYRKLWLAVSVSNIGDWFTFTLLLGLSSDWGSDSEWTGHSGGVAVSLYLLCRTLPAILFGALGGTLLDRFDKKLILVVAFALRGVLVTLMLPLLHSGPSQLPWLYLLTFANFALEGCTEPGSAALIPFVVETEADLTLANTLNGITWSVISAFGAASGGVLGSFFGPYFSLSTDAITFFITAFIVSSINPNTRQLVLQLSDDDLSSSSSSSPTRVEREECGDHAFEPELFFDAPTQQPKQSPQPTPTAPPQLLPEKEEEDDHDEDDNGFELQANPFPPMPKIVDDQEEDEEYEDGDDENNGKKPLIQQNQARRKGVGNKSLKNGSFSQPQRREAKHHHHHHHHQQQQKQEEEEKEKDDDDDEEEEEEEVTCRAGVAYAMKRPLLLGALFLKAVSVVSEYGTIASILASVYFPIGFEGEISQSILWTSFALGAVLGPVIIIKLTTQNNENNKVTNDDNTSDEDDDETTGSENENNKNIDNKSDNKVDQQAAKNEQPLMLIRMAAIFLVVGMVVSWFFLGVAAVCGQRYGSGLGVAFLAVAAAVRGIAASLVWTNSQTIIQMLSDQRMMGRMFGLDWMIFSVGAVINNILPAVLVSLWDNLVLIIVVNWSIVFLPVLAWSIIMFFLTKTPSPTMIVVP